MRTLRTVWLVLAAILLPACGFADDMAPDYRYRMTVEVETPEGVRTGSSVIAVTQSEGPAGGDPARSQTYRKIRGEAVAVGLPGGKTLFALLRSESDIEWAETVVLMAAPPSSHEPGGPSFEGAVEVRRTFPGNVRLKERSGYPMLVTFADVSDPTSVELVDPDDLAASFGEGVKLKRITVELTDDPVTTGIEEQLAWLGEHPEPRLDSNYRGSTAPNLSQSLWHGDFKRGESK